MTKNKNYKLFKTNGEINITTIDMLDQALSNCDGIHGKHIQAGRSLLIALYYSGARPIELLNMIAKDFRSDRNYFTMKVPASKRGLTRKLYFKTSAKHIRELGDYTSTLFPLMKPFWPYVGNTKKKIKRKDGSEYDYVETTRKVRYYVYKWFTGVYDESIPPYFLRHSRMSKLMESGASAEELRLFKGGKSMECVIPYLHLSQRKAKKLAKLNV